MDIHGLIRANPVELGSLAQVLNELHHEGRLEVIRSLRKNDLARIFEAAQGFHKISIDDVVPARVPALVEVAHWGKNSLPMFSSFQKRFVRVDSNESDVLWGYNEHSLKFVTGPGYFVATNSSQGEVLIDYEKIPSQRLPSWPKVVSNETGMRQLFFGGMQDVLRGITDTITIGRAYRSEVAMPNWFVLCRNDDKNLV